MTIAFDQSDDDIDVVLPRESGEIVRGRSRNGLRCFGVRQAGAADGDRLRQHHEVGVFSCCFLNERREQAAILRRGLFARRPEVNGRQTHLAGRRRVGLGQGNFAPFNLRARGPAQMQLDDGARSFRGRPVCVGDFGPARRAGLAVDRVLGFGDGQFSRGVARRPRFVPSNILALVVAPYNACQHRAPVRGNVRDAVECSEVVIVAAFDGESPRPMAVQSFARISPDNQAAAARRSAAGQPFECRPELFARGKAFPAVGLAR